MNIENYIIISVYWIVIVVIVIQVENKLMYISNELKIILHEWKYPYFYINGENKKCIYFYGTNEVLVALIILLKISLIIFWKICIYLFSLKPTIIFKLLYENKNELNNIINVFEIN